MKFIWKFLIVAILIEINFHLFEINTLGNIILTSGIITVIDILIEKYLLKGDGIDG